MVPDEHAHQNPKVTQNIQAIAELHAGAERKVNLHQRAAEGITKWLGRPRLLYIVSAVIFTWVVFNTILRLNGVLAYDPPPFFYLQTGVTVGALLMAIVVLITQNRQERIAARSEHLNLQLALLSEQRTAKIISLLEELRRDTPSVLNRTDAEAEELIKPVNPQLVNEAVIEKLLEDCAVDEDE